MNSEQLKGKTALVTGAGSGIGRAIAQELAERGAGVAVVEINAEAARQAAGEITASGLQAAPFVCDITDTEAVNRMAGAVAARFGGVDILVNNAGVGDVSTPVDQMTDEQWERMIGIHLGGAFKVCRAVVPLMKARGGGRIVNMSSQTGMVGEADFSHYSAAKAALLGFTKALARELAPVRISVNAIAPGVIETPYFARFSEKEMEQKRATVPWGRLGSTRDVACLTAFLVSDEADYITGQVISPNGGKTIVGI